MFLNCVVQVRCKQNTEWVAQELKVNAKLHRYQSAYYSQSSSRITLVDAENGWALCCNTQNRGLSLEPTCSPSDEIQKFQIHWYPLLLHFLGVKLQENMYTFHFCLFSGQQFPWNTFSLIIYAPTLRVLLRVFQKRLVLDFHNDTLFTHFTVNTYHLGGTKPLCLL